VASRLEAVESSRHQRRHTGSDCRSSPDIPALTLLHCAQSRLPSSDLRASPTPGYNTQMLSTHYKLNYSIARYKHYGMRGYQKLMSILQGPKTVTVALTVAILIVYYSSYVLLCLISHVS